LKHASTCCGPPDDDVCLLFFFSGWNRVRALSSDLWPGRAYGKAVCTKG
jgi:hypothetical protein